MNQESKTVDPRRPVRVIGQALDANPGFAGLVGRVDRVGDDFFVVFFADRGASSVWPADSIENVPALRFGAVSFNRGESFRAVIAGQIQRPEFNSQGAALAFAEPVAFGLRKSEPIDEEPPK